MRCVILRVKTKYESYYLTNKHIITVAAITAFCCTKKNTSKPMMDWDTMFKMQAKFLELQAPEGSVSPR